MESLRPLNKANFADILDYGIFLFKRHFKKIFLLNLMLNTPFILLIAILNTMLSNNYQEFFSSQEMQADSLAMFSSVFSLYAKLFLFLAVYAIHALTLKNIFEGSVVKILYSDVVLEENRSIKQVVKECFGQFGPMLLGRALYNLIQGAVFFVLYLIILASAFIVTVAVFGVFTVSAVSPWITVILAIIGVLAAIGVIFFVALTISFFMGKYWMFLPSICIEHKKAGMSVERCNNIGNNSFYLTGLTYLFSYMLVFMFPGIINSVTSLVVVASGTMEITAVVIGSIITQLVSSILQPLIVCVLTALYITLRVKREGLDMEIDLWKIKKEDASKAGRWTAEVHV